MIALKDNSTTGLYLMTTGHKIPITFGSDVFVHIDGWGRTTHEEKRIKAYIGHTGCAQGFTDLYYGPTDVVVDLEESRRSLQAHVNIKIDRWVWEWVDPNSGQTYSDLKNWFENRIRKFDLPVYRVKREHMPYGPFTSKPMFSIIDVCYDQNRYLEIV